MDHHHANDSTHSGEPLDLDALASMRSLIINPTTPDSIISSLVETLTRSLQLDGDPQLHHHTLKLLSDLASNYSHFSPRILDSVQSLSLSTGSTRLAAETLDLIASIRENGHQVQFDDQFVVSLCFAPSLSVRSWGLRNVGRFRVRPHLTLPMMLGFTKDPYPCIRRLALDGLIGLCQTDIARDCGVIRGCYSCAVELLNDAEDFVRSAAVRAVNEWGELLVASADETNRQDMSDAVFVQLCSMVRDMSMEVRVEAFKALGNVRMVSEDILLQSLSKKVLGTSKYKQCLGQETTEFIEMMASTAAGALVHGLEDEFYEVRKSACLSLSALAALSLEYAAEALNLLMGVLNNDLVVVRLQALETMLHMVSCGHLKLQETHMHVFLGTLVDTSGLIRGAARKILKSVKLHNLKLFRSCIDALLKNLETYAQDEADVFSVLFHIGQSHGKFAVCIIDEVADGIEPAFEGKLNFDNARTAAFLILAISVPTSSKKLISSIAPAIFSYTVTLLGRISFALGVDQECLLSYLSQCSRSTGISATELGKENKITHQGFKEESKLVLGSKQDMHIEIVKSVNLILEKVKDSWPLIQLGFTHEVLGVLRGCKEQLLTLPMGSLEYSGQLAFTLQYLYAVKLLAKLWTHIMPWTKHHSYSMGDMEVLLGKLDMVLRETRCKFLGMSNEEELHLLEMTLLVCVLRFHKFDACCQITAMRKLQNTLSRIEFLSRDKSRDLSPFISELVKSLAESGAFVGGAYDNPVLFERVIALFSLKHLVLHGNLKQIIAEIGVPDNDSENPIRFVPGLPVSIPFEITLHNVSNEKKLWLRMAMGEDAEEFLYLDSNLYGNCDEIRKFTLNAPFYRTPKSTFFILRVCVGVECMFEDASSVKRWGGPRRNLVYLCKGDVYLSVATMQRNRRV